jgi:blue copper oxidase
MFAHQYKNKKMKKFIIPIFILLLTAIYACKKTSDVSATAATTLSGASLANSVFTSSGTAQNTTLTVNIANAVAATVSFSIVSSGNDFTPTVYTTAITAGQASVAIPIVFDGSSTLTSETITTSAAAYASGTPVVTATIGTGTSGAYNTLWIPPTITGTTFNLTLDKSAKQFRAGNPTDTYGYNGNNFWGPTLIMNKGDNVQMNVTNNLTEATTTHWHGFHIPAIMDGGPHQEIAAGTTWSPFFQVKNNAGTYWYHPHLHMKAYEQLTYGAGGLIIIKDPAESALNLPRTYGVDDIPLVFTSRRFLTSNQFSKNLALDNYGDYMLTNGTLNAQISLPKQYVRFRILNAEIQRGLNFGFSDNRAFQVITNDGGLLNTPVSVTRVPMMPGERIEILVNLGNDAVGSTLDFKAFNSGQSFGFPGQEGGPVNPSGSAGPINGSLLNNTDFTVLHISVAAATANAVTTVPGALASNTYWTLADVTNSRTITITGGQGGSAFTFNNNTYGSTFINHTVALNAIEKWTIANNNIFGHAFHIHDINFKIISRSVGSVGTYESGWKDVVYIPLGQSVTVIAKFDDFASATNPYMFHCHFTNHEDDGMMGQFLVQ